MAETAPVPQFESERQPHAVYADAVGKAAAAPTLRLVEHTEIASRLSGFQIDLLDQFSQGQTLRQAAEILGVSVRQAAISRKGILRTFGTKSVSRATSEAIVSGQLPIKKDKDPEARSVFKRSEVNVIAFYARGGKNQQIASSLKIGVEKVEEYHDRLLAKAGVWNRPQLVRRAHELELFTAPEDAFRQTAPESQSPDQRSG